MGMAEPYATVGKMVIALGVVLLALGGWLLIVAKYMPEGEPLLLRYYAEDLLRTTGDAARLTARLAKYRLKLTTFLHRAEVDATNNAAERALRPAVVMRKVTGGSRSAAGAKAWAMVASLVRTAQQQGRAALTTLEALLQAAWAGTPCALLAPVVAGSDTS